MGTILLPLAQVGTGIEGQEDKAERTWLITSEFLMTCFTIFRVLRGYCCSIVIVSKAVFMDANVQLYTRAAFWHMPERYGTEVRTE